MFIAPPTPEKASSVGAACEYVAPTGLKKKIKDRGATNIPPLTGL
jgi:hypothetical protein